MISHELLRRNPLKSGYEQVHYNPYTLVLRYPSSSRTYERTSVAEGRFRFLGDEEEPSQNLLRFDGEVSHELVHWFQHHGTTVGCFSSEVRKWQRRTTINWSQGDQAGHLFSNYVSKRYRHGYKPLINLTSGGEFRHPKAREPLKMFAQIWFDHQVTDLMMFNSHAQDRANFPRGTVFGEVVGDIISFFDDSETLDQDAVVSLRKHFALPDGSVSFIKLDNERLTTSLLMEGAATAVELLNSFYMPFKDGRSTADALKKLLETPYGLSLRLLASKINLDPDDAIDILPTLCAVTDVALNPPLPPVVLEPPASSWKWPLLYPPLRFAALCDHVGKMPWLPHNADHDTIKLYQAQLCDMSGLIDPSTYRVEHLVTRPTKDFSEISGNLEDHINGETFWDYIKWVQAKMWHERKRSASLFINFASCKSGDLSRDYAATLLDIHNARWLAPPLIWSGNNMLAYTQPDHCFENLICLASTFESLVYEIPCGSGKFDLSAFPPDVRVHKALQEMLTDSLALNFPGVDMKLLHNHQGR